MDPSRSRPAGWNNYRVAAYGKKSDECDLRGVQVIDGRAEDRSLR